MLNQLLSHPSFAQTKPYSTLKAKPLGFVDVGARGEVHPLVEPIASATAVLGFEPDEEECARLREDSHSSPWAEFEVEPIALADQQGERDLHLLAVPTNHSLLPPNTALTRRYNMVKFEEIGKVSLQTTTLDNVLFGSRQSADYWGELLKLDTQGTEFEILQGATRTLTERTVAIYTEVEFCSIYTGQKLFSDVEQFLRDHGFSFYGLGMVGNRSCKRLDKRREGGRERMIWADAIFFKDPLVGGFPTALLSERQIHILFVCTLLLGYYEFALELSATWATGYEMQSIEELIHDLAALPPQKSYADAIALAERVQKNPDLATVEVGRFVDTYRSCCDYSDVIV